MLGPPSNLHVSGVLWSFHGVIGTVLRTLYSYIRGADEDQRGSRLYTIHGSRPHGAGQCSVHRLPDFQLQVGWKWVELQTGSAVNKTKASLPL